MRIKQASIASFNHFKGLPCLLGLAYLVLTLACLVGCAREEGVTGPLPQGIFETGELGYVCPAGAIDIAAISRANGFTLAELGPQALSASGATVTVFDSNGDNIPDALPVGDKTLRLCIPNDTVSFVIQGDDQSVVPKSDDARSLITSFIPPNGGELIASTVGLEYIFSPARPAFGGTQQVSSVAYPKNPEAGNGGGVFDVRVAAMSANGGNDVPADSLAVSIAIRRGESKRRGLLGMRAIVVDGANLNDKDIRHLKNDLVAELNAIYARTNLQIDPRRFELGFVRTKGLGVVRATRSELKELTSAAIVDERGQALSDEDSRNMVHVYITGSVLDPADNSVIFALSSGIPGALGFPASVGSGVFLSANAVRSSVGSFVSRTLHLAIAHEIGHWLGLHHTTEAFGTEGDPLSDTPSCPPEFDKGGGPNGSPNGRVEGIECISRDGENLMFWNALGTDISKHQGTLLGWSPLLQVQGGNRQ